MFSAMPFISVPSLWFDLLPPTSPLFSPLCVSVWKVQWSHLAALKSSSAAPPPVVSRSHSFSEPAVPSFAHLHLRSQEPHSHHHHPSAAAPSAARTDPQPPASGPSDEVPPRVRKDSPGDPLFQPPFVVPSEGQEGNVYSLSGCPNSSGITLWAFAFTIIRLCPTA